MSYFTAQNGTVELIARRGYGGMPATGMGDLWDTLTGAISTAAGKAADIYNTAQKQSGAAAALQTAVATQAAAKPIASASTLIPVLAIGGAAIVAVVLLTRGKSGG